MSAKSTTEMNRNMNAPHADVEVPPEVESAILHIGADDSDYGKFARALRDQLGLSYSS